MMHVTFENHLMSRKRQWSLIMLDLILPSSICGAGYGDSESEAGTLADAIWMGWVYPSD
jgi:hypothetical protein